MIGQGIGWGVGSIGMFEGCGLGGVDDHGAVKKCGCVQEIGCEQWCLPCLCTFTFAFS